MNTNKPTNEALVILFTIMAIVCFLVLYWAITGEPFLIDNPPA